MDIETGYYIERLSAERLADISTLHEAVYGRKRPRSFFSDKYDTAFTGVSYIGYIAYSHAHVPVAYHGVVPCFLQKGSGVMLAAQSADVMTHPEYRFKGLFVELSEMTFRLCRSEGIRILFGFPNQHSLHGAIHKLGWRMTGTMDWFIIPVKTLPLEKIAAKHPVLQYLYESYVRLSLKKYASFWAVENSVVQDGFTGVQRSMDYWKYKGYYKRYVIRTGETLVWIKISNGMTVGDMNIAGDFAQVIALIRKLAVRLGLKQINLHTMQGTALHGLLLRQWKPVPSYPVLFQDFDSGWDISDIKFNFGDIDIF